MNNDYNYDRYNYNNNGYNNNYNNNYNNGYNYNNSYNNNFNKHNKKRKNNIFSGIISFIMICLIIYIGLIVFNVVDNPLSYFNKELSPIKLSYNNLEMRKGESLQLITTSDNSDMLIYNSSDSNIVSVNDVTGYIVANGYGTAVITVSLKNNSDIKDECLVEVVNPMIGLSVDNIILNNTSLTMNIGETKNLSYKIIPTTAATTKIVWSTSNSNVVSVDKNGKIKGVSVGSAIITVKTENGKYSTCKVNVVKNGESKIINEYTLTYNPNGGKVNPLNKILDYGEEYGDLPIPTKGGYTFKGWYTEAVGGFLVFPNMKINNDTTIYAHWVDNIAPKQTNKSEIYISYFGAKCDGITDDTTAIKNAFEYASNNDITTINLGTGKCVISSPIQVVCNTSTSNSNVRRKLMVTGTATITHKNITFLSISSGCDEVKLENFTSLSNYDSKKRDLNNDGKIDGSDSITHIGVSSLNTNLHLTINNASFVGGVSGTSMNNLKSLTVSNSTFRDMKYIPEYGRGGYGILCQGCQNVKINNSKFIAGLYYRHGIYISVGANNQQNNNVEINNCEFDYSGISKMDLKSYNYPFNMYPTAKESNIWSPDTSPIMVRKTNGFIVSNCVFKNTPNTGVYTAQNGSITNVNIKNNTIYPTIRKGEYNYGVMFKGIDKSKTVTGVVDNLKVVNPPANYKYVGVSNGASMTINNANTSLPAVNISGSGTIKGFNGKIEKSG